METKHEYRSEALGAIHGTMAALESIGVLSKVTMREFDSACLRPVQELDPETIRALLEREHLSQAVFASYLNISNNLVSDWNVANESQAGQP